jgi:hypothetical protein
LYGIMVLMQKKRLDTKNTAQRLKAENQRRSAKNMRDTAATMRGKNLNPAPKDSPVRVELPGVLLVPMT